jgi:nucleotide-binding universal stress UspA family protein
MANIGKILVPVDFSEAAADAARYAAALADRFESELTMLHVAPPLNFEFSMAQPTPRRHQELTQHRDETLRNAFALFPGAPAIARDAVRKLAEGDPAETIVREAQQHDYGLIVMPTRGRGPLQRWLLIGSVTMKVLHQAECAVLAGLDFGARFEPFDLNHVVCAVDLGPQSEKVLRWGWELARETRARLTVVHAAPGAGESAADFFDESWRLTLKSRLRDKVAELEEKTGVEGDIVVENGDPHKVVAAAARRLGADLVVIGRGVSNDLLGRLRAHAYEIIRQSPCPVVSI